MKSKKTFRIMAAVAVFILGICLIVGGYIWFDKKQDRVLAGTAKPYFPYSDYSIEELNKMHPQYVNENVATTQAPEVTYRKFKNFLTEKDIDSALSLIFSRYQDKYRELFKEKLSEDVVASLASNLEDNIIKQEDCSETRCVYKMQSSGAEVSFIKNSQGVWLIESL